MREYPHLSILVNSSDHFDDCWEPFFQLFSIYWPTCDLPIFLNTETKDWAYPGLQIKCSQVQLRSAASGRLTWSECLLAGLDQLNTPLVLYLQEDYFIERAVNSELIYELSQVMMANSEIRHIGLTHFGSQGPFESTGDLRLWKISQYSRYRVSTQAGLWRVASLKSYLRPHENGWMFEIFGTRRAQRRSECFLTLNRDASGPAPEPAIQYMHTGVLKGKWNPGIPALFARHRISIDYGKRGMYRPRSRLQTRMETAARLITNPRALVRSLAGR